jgi:hypothetical protein
MLGMLSAAIMVLVFVLVAALCGGSVVWLFRAASPSSDYCRSPREAPAQLVADTLVDVPAPPPALEYPEGHFLALPAAAEPRELEAPPATEPPEPAETPAEPNPAAATPEDGEPSDGARIYVLDSSRRPSR